MRTQSTGYNLDLDYVWRIKEIESNVAEINPYIKWIELTERKQAYMKGSLGHVQTINEDDVFYLHEYIPWVGYISYKKKKENNFISI